MSDRTVASCGHALPPTCSGQATTTTATGQALSASPLTSSTTITSTSLATQPLPPPPPPNNIVEPLSTITTASTPTVTTSNPDQATPPPLSPQPPPTITTTQTATSQAPPPPITTKKSTETTTTLATTAHIVGTPPLQIQLSTTATQFQPPTATPSEETITIAIMLFNVSAGKGFQWASEAQLQDGIDKVLDQPEVKSSIRDTLFLVLAHDNVTNPKQNRFTRATRGLSALRRLATTGDKTVLIVMNDKADNALNQDMFTCVSNLFLRTIRNDLADVTLRLQMTRRKRETTPLTEKYKDLVERMRDNLEELLDVLYSGPVNFREYLFRMTIYLSELIPPFDIRVLVVCWHGPYSGLTRDTQKRAIFRKLLHIMEKVRQLCNRDVAMIGGDFNLPKEAAQAVVTDMMKNNVIPPASVCCLPVKQKRLDAIDYLVVWPSRCLVSLDGSRQIFPSEPGHCRPFDHPTMLYKLKLRK